MRISIQSNLKKLTKNLNNIQKKQIPFATAKALTATAIEARAAAKKAMVSKLDRPTPWTVRGVLYEKATKHNLKSAVYIKDDRARYLKWQISGGTRKARNKALLIPGNIKLNKYGNLPRNRVAKLRAKDNVFSGKVDGVGGIYQRYKRKAPKLLVSFEKQVKYGVKYPFGKIVKGSVRRNFEKNFSNALAQALKTAR